jgi:hypothetical protein
MQEKETQITQDELRGINRKWKKRKRIHRPNTLIAFGIFFLILPFLNYIGIAIRFKHMLIEFSNIMGELYSLEMILLVIPVFVGVGILLVQTWGWWLFIFYAILLTLHNSITIFHDPAVYNLNSLIQTVIAFAAIYYFLKKEVSAPYLFRPKDNLVLSNILENYGNMFNIPNGWRRAKRRNAEIRINLSNHALVTKNLSSSGFYADWIDPPFQPNDAVQIDFKINDKSYDLKGGVVRVDETGIGIAFRDLTKEMKKSLESSIISIKLNVSPLGRNIMLNDHFPI